MAEEPRRSGRATKGQHTKDREGEEAQAKGKGKGKGRKSKTDPEPEEEEEEDEVIRCVCGLYEEEEEVARSMICCDNCSAWQHNDCMGLAEDYQPDTYFCEQCRPQDHKELLAAMKRGEKPWEEAAKRREQAEAEKAGKKKGKKGRKSGTARTSDAPRTPTLEPEEPSTKKRKLEETPIQNSKSKKVRGATEDANGDQSEPKESVTPAKEDGDTESGIPEPVGDVKELTNGTRKSAASGLIKLFVEQAKTAVKSGELSLPSGTSPQSAGNQIGLEVENAVYHVQSGGKGEPIQAYKNQLRTILYNVKINTALTIQLLTGDLTAERLASMDSKEMASDEQKKKDAEIMKEMERQNTIVEEQGPRIRRTHKGEEYVDENRQMATESATSNSSVRKPSAVDQDVEMRSPDAATSGDKVMRKPSAASKGRPFGDPRRKSSSNFDIDKVWSGVQGSPTETDAPKFPDISQSRSPPPDAGATGADPEIDNLLKDEDGDSEPYSPKEYTEEGVIWRGRINGGSLGNFISVAKFAAGAQPDADTLRMSWTEVIPAEIKLHGRIQPSKADDYLCGLEYSNTTELVIVSIAEPKSAHDQQQFDKFFKYLKTKERYGVGMQHQVPAIKDIYLLPLDAGQPLPSVMKALEHSFPDPVQERQFLVPIVIKWTELPHNVDRMQQEGLPLSPSVGPPVAQTPITPHENQASFQQYPSQPMNGAVPAYSSTTGQYSTPPPPYGNMPMQTTPAAANALRILGPELASAPAVVELVKQAPNAGENEFNIIRECILEKPEAAQSLFVLTQSLRDKHGARQQAQSQPDQKANVQV